MDAGFRRLQDHPAISRTQRRHELSEFKTIFWWEWSHGCSGVIGAVYLLPFLFFLWRGMLGLELKRRLWLIFASAHCRARSAGGWWLGAVAAVEVSQYRLATHLVLAL